MKILRIEYLIKSQKLGDTGIAKQIEDDIIAAIKKVTHPIESNYFIINPTRKGNGVKPIKNQCMKYLSSKGWSEEEKLKITSETQPGKLDAVKYFDTITAAVEWETGNISSSHRALNKMAVGFIENKLQIGYLILPSRSMYNYLTDRVGNYKEICPYFPMWKALKLDGILGVIEIEHDKVSVDVPLIRKGTDGRALV